MPLPCRKLKLVLDALESAVVFEVKFLMIVQHAAHAFSAVADFFEDVIDLCL